MPRRSPNAWGGQGFILSGSTPKPGAYNCEPCPANAGDGHYWLLEAPNGPVSKGRCKRCGAEREYGNSLEEFNWMDSDGRHRPSKGKRHKQQPMRVKARNGVE